MANELEPGYRMHAFICGHERPEGAARGCCANKNSLELMKALKNQTRKSGIDDVRVQKSGCLNYCEDGPTCVIYPQGKWFKITEDSIEELVEYLKGGEEPTSHKLVITTSQGE